MSKPAITPIETQYAGCRFRSRLEARWAVFFDALDIEWEYEAQGFETPAGKRYLPDFWLPELQLHVEVKGVFSHADFMKTMLAVPGLSEPVGGQIHPKLLILGPVPRPGLPWVHVRVDTLDGMLLWQQTFFSGPHWCPQTIRQAVVLRSLDGATEERTEFFRDAAVEPAYDQRLTVDPQVDAAYRAARSARFEFGESG